MKKRMGELLFGVMILLMFTVAGCAEAKTGSDDETVATDSTASATDTAESVSDTDESATDAADSTTETAEDTADIAVISGWVTADGETYYYDENGEMYAGGWYTIEGNLYYFFGNGKMNYGWMTATGGRYYCDPETGVRCIGWVTIGTSGKTYYFWPNTGIMVTGLQKISGKIYYFNSDGSMFTGWRDSDGEQSYFALSTGAAETGWSEIEGYTYYFDASGVLQTNKIVGSESEGYYYVDDNGIRVTAEEITYAVEFIMAHSTADASNATRLKECYDYLWNNYPYNRTYETPDASTMSEEAIAIFSNGYGNCYKYAAAFACIAKVLGYDARVCVGEISSRKGGMTPHGWMEVESDGSWYLCDPDMQMNYPTRNVYMVTESAYPYKHNVITKYVLTITNGEVSWE